MSAKTKMFLLRNRSRLPITCHGVTLAANKVAVSTMGVLYSLPCLVDESSL